MEKTDIAGNISRIKAGLPPSVRLVAVSKFHPAESVEEAFRAGQVLFGENRVQEAAAKFDELRSRGIEPELHIIGSLQRNKVKEAVRIASCIQSVDRMELLSEIEKRCAQL
ncbi:alanine racemase, partial [Treponema saccharophilum]|uniref:alanine racemase n=1 Tax=Treponema saccharophilum TaxID=165 RepID=UPI00386D3229